MHTNTNMPAGSIIVMAIIMTLLLGLFLLIITRAARKPYNELPQSSEGDLTLSGTAQGVDLAGTSGDHPIGASSPAVHNQQPGPRLAPGGH